MKRIVIATMLSTALLAAPVAQAASNQDRAMATGAVVGATAGGVIGAGQNQAVQGAIFGAVLGTIAGAVIASNSQPVYVEPQRTYHKPAVRHYQPHVQHYKPRTQYRQPAVRKVVYVQPQRQHKVRYVASRSRDHDYRERD